MAKLLLIVVVTLLGEQAIDDLNDLSPGDLLRRGQVALRNEDKALATRAFDLFLKRFPVNEMAPRVRVELGQIQFDAAIVAESVGDSKLADQKLTEAFLTLTTPSSRALDASHRESTDYLLGLIAYQKARRSRSKPDYATAAETFSKFLDGYPNSQNLASASFYRIETLRLTGDRADALIAAARDFESKKLDIGLMPAVQLAKGNALASRSDLEGRTLEEKTKDRVEAEQAYRAILLGGSPPPQAARAALGLSKILGARDSTDNRERGGRDPLEVDRPSFDCRGRGSTCPRRDPRDPIQGVCEGGRPP